MCPGTELWQGNISLPKCGHESYGEWPGHTTHKHKHKTTTTTREPQRRLTASSLRIWARV